MKSRRHKAIRVSEKQLYRSQLKVLDTLAYFPGRIACDRYFEITEPETLAEIKEMFDLRYIDVDRYHQKLKSTANYCRKEIGVDCVIGFTLAVKEEEEMLLVLLFEKVKATDSSFFKMRIDEELNFPYLAY